MLTSILMSLKASLLSHMATKYIGREAYVWPCFCYHLCLGVWKCIHTNKSVNW